MLSQRSRYVDVAKPAIKLTVSLIVVSIIGSIILNILDSIPRLSFTITAMANMGIGFVMILVVLFFGMELSIAVKRAFKSYPELFTIAYSLVQLLAIWIAYTSFSRVFDLVLLEWSWAYSLSLLGIALIPGVRAGVTLIKSVDKWIDHRPIQQF